jgi:hypothetical protein
LGQFSILKDVDQMERDVLFGGLKKLGDLELGKPDGAVLQPQVDLGFSVIGGVKDHIAHAATSLRLFLTTKGTKDTKGRKGG